MQDAIQAYYDTRTANQCGITVEQVRTLNRLEAEHEQWDDLLLRENEFVVEIPKRAPGRIYCEVFVETVTDGFLYRGHVKPDGTVRWDRGY